MLPQRRLYKFWRSLSKIIVSSMFMLRMKQLLSVVRYSKILLCIWRFWIALKKVWSIIQMWPYFVIKNGLINLKHILVVVFSIDISWLKVNSFNQKNVWQRGLSNYTKNKNHIFIYFVRDSDSGLAYNCN